MLTAPKPGFAVVYESGKSGNRFKESVLKFNTNSVINTNPKLNITIDKSKEYQKIIGFGGAFTDVFGGVLNLVPKQLSDYILEGYFGPNGSEYTMGRVPVAATDYSFHYYSYDDIENDKNLTHFALAKEDHELRV